MLKTFSYKVVVIASLLYAILAYERYHRNTLLLEGREICMQCTCTQCLLWVVCLPPATKWKFHEGKKWPALLIDVNQAPQPSHGAWVKSKLLNICLINSSRVWECLQVLGLFLIGHCSQSLLQLMLQG